MAAESRIGWIALLVRSGVGVLSPRFLCSVRARDPVFPAIGIQRVFAVVGLQNSRPQISDFNFIPIRSTGAVYASGSIVHRYRICMMQTKWIPNVAYEWKTDSSNAHVGSIECDELRPTLFSAIKTIAGKWIDFSADCFLFITQKAEESFLAFFL